MPVIRYDHFEIKAQRDDKGFLRDVPVVARSGLYTYRNPDCSARIECRPKSEVFNQDSLNRFAGIPLTIGHPPDLVNSKNYKKYSVGSVVGAGVQDGDTKLRAPIVINDDSAISSAKTEFKGLSVGYELDLEDKPGWYNEKNDDIIFEDKIVIDGKSVSPGSQGYSRFDAIQRNIRPNHLALCRKGRAGTIARLNLDSDEIIEHEVNTNMPKIRLDNGIEYDAAPEVIQAFEAQKTAIATVTARADTAEKSLNVITGERDGLKKTVDDLPAQLEKARKDGAEDYKNRVKLENAAKLAGVKFDDATSDDAIKRSFIKTVSNLDVAEDADAGYLDGAFNVAVAQHEAAKDKSRQRLDSFRHKEPEPRNDAADDGLATTARQKMIERDRSFNPAKRGGE